MPRELKSRPGTSPTHPGCTGRHIENVSLRCHTYNFTLAVAALDWSALQERVLRSGRGGEGMDGNGEINELVRREERRGEENKCSEKRMDGRGGEGRRDDRLEEIR